jgi:hypothetical protein
MSINKKMQTELEERMQKWVGKVIETGNLAMALDKAAKDFKAVTTAGTEAGTVAGLELAKWQATVVERMGAGFEAIETAVEAERERALEVVSEVFERVPEDTVLGSFGVQIQEAIASTESEDLDSETVSMSDNQLGKLTGITFESN